MENVTASWMVRETTTETTTGWRSAENAGGVRY
jgi:hypothetical protein